MTEFKSIRASLPITLWNSIHVLAFERRQNIQMLVHDALRHYIGCQHRDEVRKSAHREQTKRTIVNAQNGAS